jgi:hypothetical protein
MTSSTPFRRQPIILDCSDCPGYDTEACDDCLVRVVLDEDERRAVGLIADAGLLDEAVRLRLVG